MPLPYPSTTWPAGTTEAAKDKVRALAARGSGLTRSKEEFAQAIAMIGAPLKTPARAAAFDGEAVSEVEADKLRSLQPARKTLGVRWAA